MMERLVVEIGRIRGASGGVVRKGERAEGIAVERQLPRDEVDALLLARFIEVLKASKQSVRMMMEKEESRT